LCIYRERSAGNTVEGKRRDKEDEKPKSPKVNPISKRVRAGNLGETLEAPQLKVQYTIRIMDKGYLPCDICIPKNRGLILQSRTPWTVAKLIFKRR
jgi:hypothetical protein